mmetsp:Transcript_137365/g.310062  ORF Transcript_137365/g.310062 Transcript_137365/m.310062 type:complete len:233 (-) Transcript_137365:53-751(-)
MCTPDHMETEAHQRKLVAHDYIQAAQTPGQEPSPASARAVASDDRRVHSDVPTDPSDEVPDFVEVQESGWWFCKPCKKMCTPDHMKTEAHRKKLVAQNYIQAAQTAGQANRTQPFVLDTNVLLGSLDVLPELIKRGRIVISGNVMQELDKFKTGSSLRAKQSRDASSRIAELQQVDSSCIVIDPTKGRSADDQILILARSKGAILVTDDRNLRICAQQQHVTVWSVNQAMQN